MGQQISSWTVGQLLHQMGHSLRVRAKTVEGAHHPGRDARFHHINDEAKRGFEANQLVISVDSKRKELMVDKRPTPGREWQPRRSRPDKVDVHDFPDPEVRKAVPYGIYDNGADEGWTEVGSDRTPPSSQSTPSGRGGRPWTSSATPEPAASWSRPMLEAPTGIATSSGRSSWPSWRPGPVSRSRSAAIKPLCLAESAQIGSMRVGSRPGHTFSFTCR